MSVGSDFMRGWDEVLEFAKRGPASSYGQQEDVCTRVNEMHPCCRKREQAFFPKRKMKKHKHSKDRMIEFGVRCRKLWSCDDSDCTQKGRACSARDSKRRVQAVLRKQSLVRLLLCAARVSGLEENNVPKNWVMQSRSRRTGRSGTTE